MAMKRIAAMLLTSVSCIDAVRSDACEAARSSCDSKRTPKRTAAMADRSRTSAHHGRTGIPDRTSCSTANKSVGG